MFSGEKSDVMGIGFSEQCDQVDDDADQEQNACKKMQKPHARSSGNSAPPPSAPQYLSQCREQKKASSFDK